MTKKQKQEKEDWVMSGYNHIQELFNDDHTDTAPYGMGFAALSCLCLLIIDGLINPVEIPFGIYVLVGAFFLFYYVTWNITWTLIILPALIKRFFCKFVFKL